MSALSRGFRARTCAHVHVSVSKMLLVELSHINSIRNSEHTSLIRITFGVESNMDAFARHINQKYVPWRNIEPIKDKSLVLLMRRPTQCLIPKAASITGGKP